MGHIRRPLPTPAGVPAEVPGVVPAEVSADGARRPELRREPRLATLFRTARLMSGVGETICRVRNISANGFMADACPAPSVGASIALELCEGRRHSARVVWAQGERFGAEFLVSRPVRELLSDGDRGADRTERALRLAPADGFATIRHGDRATRASIVNISQTGMAVFAYELDLAGTPDRRLVIEIDGLDATTGFLCWSSQGAAGLQFERPLSFETLSHWLWAISLAVGEFSLGPRFRPPASRPRDSAGAIRAAADPRPR